MSPEIVDAQNWPEGTADFGIHRIICGNWSAKSRARETRPWKVMIRRRSCFRAALATAMWLASAAASVMVFPSTETKTPCSA